MTLHGTPGTFITQAKIQFVYWGSYWTGTGQSERTAYDQAWNDVGNSPAFYARLVEYSTGEQTIGTGTWIGSTLADTSLASGVTITETQIQQELAAELAEGTVASNAAGRIYVVMLPPGVTSQLDFQNNFAGHHSQFVNPSGGGLPIVYAVITYDSDTGYNDPLISHEISESITDPDLSTGWYDSTGAEIGDLCRFNYATLDGYTIEQIWSDKACACVGASTTGSDAGTDSGTTGSCNPTVPSYQQARCNQTAVYNGNLYECISQAVSVNGETTGCGTTGVYCSTIAPDNPAWGSTAWHFVQTCSTTCTPTTCAAQGKNCGSISDGCGGTLSCGTCPSGQTCSSSNVCQTSCTPNCSGLQCGGDGCGGSCGTCGSGQTCNTTGQCVSPLCTPSCTGKQCGSDGCAGSCGDCPSGQSCTSTGVCQSSVTQCGRIAPWDPNKPWYDYVVGEESVGSNSHVYSCTNVAYCVYDPTSYAGITYGWTDLGPC